MSTDWKNNPQWDAYLLANHEYKDCNQMANDLGIHSVSAVKARLHGLLTGRKTMRKLVVVETGSNSFQLQENGLIIYACRRQAASPNHWEAIDVKGECVDKDKYRADLVERLQMKEVYTNLEGQKFYGTSEGITRELVREMASNFSITLPEELTNDQMQDIAQAIVDWNSESMSDSNDYGDTFESTLNSMFPQEESSAPPAIAIEVPEDGAVMGVEAICENIGLWTSRHMTKLFRVERVREDWSNELSNEEKSASLNQDLYMAYMTLDANGWVRDTQLGDMRINAGEPVTRYLKYEGDHQYDLVISKTVNRAFITIREL
jgi:hypothetical protein